MSVFLAIDLDDVVRREVMALTSDARARVTAKWLPAEKLHLTLVFVGNVDPEEIAPRLVPLSKESGLRLRLSGAGTFVTARAPSVLWLGVDGEMQSLAALQQVARTELEVEQTQDWRPHVTLARAHVPLALEPQREAFSPFSSSVFAVRHLTLYESTHHQFRAVHRVSLRE